MTFPAILIITALSGEIKGYITYPDIAACNRATATVSDTLGYDHAMTCQELPASRSIRPLRNPIYGETK